MRYVSAVNLDYVGADRFRMKTRINQTVFAGDSVFLHECILHNSSLVARKQLVECPKDINI